MPVRLHWTLPIGALVFSGGAFAPFFWLGFFVLVFLHELGHAIIVRRLGYRVTAIDITGFGGMCRWSGAASRLERSLISWGGVGAQLVILALTFGLVTIFPFLALGWTGQLVSVFLWTNLWLAAINLLPFPPLDGHQAWQLVSELRRPSGRRELKRVLFSRPLRSRPQPQRTPEPPPRTDAPASKGSMGTKELADLLRNIGDQAGKARTPDKRHWN
ncbi:MAG: hypothetical protein HY898_10425 [Deltaproteobacteria bacterium]|nr:hypothetical protein [Deltaproteobacteria bacterium]